MPRKKEVGNTTQNGEKQHMKIDYKKEAAVFAAVKERGEGTRAELLECLKTKFNFDLTESELLRYLGMWKAKKTITVRTRANEEVWAMADIPPWYCSGIMALVQSASGDLKAEIDALDDRLKNDGGRVVDPKSIWQDFVSYKMIFETLDPILGGHQSTEDRKTIFPRNHGKLVIPAAWFYGLIRDNQGLMNVAALHYHTAIGVGQFRGEPKVSEKVVKVKMGMNAYESVDEGSQFEIVMRFPSKGSKLKTKADIQRFFDLIAEASIRGLGAYPRAFGGRIKLVEMQELSA